MLSKYLLSYPARGATTKCHILGNSVNRNVLFTVCTAKSKIRCQFIWFLVRALFLPCSWLPLLVLKKLNIFENLHLFQALRPFCIFEEIT